MEVASCSTIATLLVRNETVPIKILVPRFSKIATPITSRKRNGYDQAVVLMHSTANIIMTATVRMRFISLSTFSVRDLFCTAIPT